MGAAAAAPNLWLFEVTAAAASASAVIAVYGPRMSVRMGLPGQDGRTTQGALPLALSPRLLELKFTATPMKL